MGTVRPVRLDELPQDGAIQTDRQTDTNRQTDRHTHTDRQTDRELFKLNMDGSQMRDASGNSMPTYDNEPALHSQMSRCLQMIYLYGCTFEKDVMSPDVRACFL